jgi:hypothetical protein
MSRITAKLAVLAVLVPLNACTHTTTPPVQNHVSWSISSPSPRSGLPTGVGEVQGQVVGQPSCSFSHPACEMPAFMLAAKITLTSTSGRVITGRATRLAGFDIEVPGGTYLIAVTVTDPRAAGASCPAPIQVTVPGGRVLSMGVDCAFSA